MGRCECCGALSHATARCQRLWTKPFLTTKNTFLEVLPPLSKSALGFKVMRRQISAPTLPVGVFGDADSSDETELSPPPTPEVSAQRGAAIDDGKRPGSTRPPCSPRSPTASETHSLSTAAASNGESPMSGDDSDREFHLLDHLGPLDHPCEEDRGEVWSEGSALHEQGRCRPCAFVNTPTGCKAEARCRFCHLQHTSVKRRVRPCKGKRERLRRLVERFRCEVDAYVASGRPVIGIMDYLLSLELPMMVEDNESLKKTVFAQLRAYVEETHGAKLCWDLL